MLHLLLRNLKKATAVLASLSLYCTAAPDNHSAPQAASLLAKQQNATLLFTENKGQVADNTGKARRDILFTAHSGATNIFLTNTGIFYQFTNVIYPEGYALNLKDVTDPVLQEALQKKIRTETYRFSFALGGANLHPRIHARHKNNVTENFYLPQCPGGITDVATYQKIVYENVYPHIDWVVYSQGSQMKYDFVVHPGGNPSSIKLHIKDAGGVSITENGGLLMQTKLGEVREQAPVSYAKGRSVPTHFRQNNDGSIGFEVDKIPAGATLIIDPAITWATYFGGAGSETSTLGAIGGIGCSTDASGNAYITGGTTSASGIASSGYQNTPGGTADGFLAKFSPTGALVWATYYGGTANDNLYSCAADASGNIYAGGYTSGSTGLATAGAYLAAPAGSSDMIMVKFNSSGGRVWATYYGLSTSADIIEACATDGSGNVFFAGYTTSTTGLSTSGVAQGTGGGGMDGFLIKFNGSTGGRVWATYYGGSGVEQFRSLAVDASGDVYAAGYSASAGMSSGGVYQPLNGGGQDALLVKFSGSAGTRDWATYYGGAGTDEALGCALDGSGGIYITGVTASSSGIATAGVAQSTIGGGNDAFIARLDAATGSSLSWGSYYGGTGADQGNGCAIDASTGTVFIGGTTSSSTGIDSTGFQATIGGGASDAMIVKLNAASGALIWASYFGNTGDETGMGVAFNSGKIYLAGNTSSSSGITTSTAYQKLYGSGASDAFLAQIIETPLSIITDTISPVSYCVGAGVRVPYTATGTFGSGNVFTAQLSDNTGSFTIPVNIGTLTSTKSDTINATIPIGAGAGTHYRIRVISNAPADTGTDNLVDLTIIPLPSPASITGPGTVCALASISLSDATPGGIWSSAATGIATVGSSGTVTGVAGGTATISYSVTNVCGVADSTVTVTVNPLPVSGTISGPAIVCVAATTPLSDGATGGVWSSDATSIATVSGGVVSGVSAGTATISYTVINSCGTSTTTTVITVNPLPVSGTISGLAIVCVAATTPLSDAATGGTWSSTATAIVTISSSGVVTGVSAGTSTISYTVTNSCGTSATTTVVTVNPLPVSGTITGPAVVCVLATTPLSDAATGGTWSSDATSIATVSSGVVSGVSAGTATISYTVTNSCGTSATTTVVTVNALPVSGTITGPAIVCASATTPLSDAATGGVWSSTTTLIATVSGSGVVGGVSAGTATISYTVTNSCGASATTTVVTVNPLPVPGTITGSATVCVSATTPLSDAATGGIWSSTATTIATVTSSGLVNGVSTGTATISYTVTNGCGTAVTNTVVTVNALPVSGTITGSGTVCVSATTPLSDAVTGGTWSSTATAIATVSGSGVVSGISAGTTTISYTVTNSCGASTTTTVVTVNPLPVAGTIAGAAIVCVSATTPLSDAATGGTWSSTATSIATVSSTGLVSGISAGSATISYTVTNGCGTAVTNTVVTVNALPVAGTITGSTTVCVSAFTLLSDAAAGGTWSSAATSIATVSSTGAVSGISAGTATISYAVTNSCGTLSTTTMITVNPLPVSGSIAGSSTVCVSGTISLSDAVAGGAWYSTSTAIATVGSTGMVSGISAGTAIIYYTVTNSCGTSSATVTVTVIASPVAGSIIGLSTVCVSGAISLTDAVAGGTWSSGATSIAAISGSGVVTGVSTGTAAIFYTVTTICGVAVTTTTVTVYPPLPDAGTITGPDRVCALSTISLSDAATGGNWASGSTTVATISSTGDITAIAAGTVIIYYSVINGCGTVSATKTVTVDPLPVPLIVETGYVLSTSKPYLTYQWQLAGTPITGATNATYTANDNGSYAVTVSDNNGCTGTSVVKIVSGLAVNNIVAGDDISIYPNPVQYVLTISAPVKVNISVLGADGKEWIKENDVHNVNVSSLAPGCYIIRVYNEQNVLVKIQKLTKL